MNCIRCIHGVMKVAGEVNLKATNIDEFSSHIFQATNISSPYRVNLLICSLDECGHVEWSADKSFNKQLKADKYKQHTLGRKMAK